MFPLLELARYQNPHCTIITLFHKRKEKKLFSTTDSLNKNQKQVSNNQNSSKVEPPAIKKKTPELIPTTTIKNINNNKNNKREREPKLIETSFLLRIPKTEFSCKDRAPGYYADMETDCQVHNNQFFLMLVLLRRTSFLDTF